jgi:ABC-type lipoprotein release transport system permease subunit
MAGIRLRVAAWLRANWARTIPVVVLVAVVAGAALSLAVGARRTATAPDRYTAAHGGDADLSLFQFEGPPLIDAVRDLDGVERAYATTFVGAGPVGDDGLVLDNINPFAGDDDANGAELVEGRFTDDAASDEFTVNESLAELMDLDIGDRLRNISLSQEQVSANDFDVENPGGPTFEATLVGIVSTPSDFDNPFPTITYSNGLLDAHPDIGIVATLMTVFVEDDVAPSDVYGQIQALPFGDTVFESDEQMVTQSSRDAVGFQVTALWIVTIVALVAAALVAGQLIARHLRTTAGERAPLQALGYRPRQIAAEAAIEGAAIGVIAAMLAAVVATLGSALFPLGVLRGFEPDPGPRLDVAVVVLGGIGLVVVVAVTAAIAAGRSAILPVARPRKATVADRLATAGAKPALVHGARFALGRSARRGVPPLAVIIGTAVSIVGLVGAFVVGLSVLRVGDEPERWGRNFDLIVGNPFLPAATDLVAAASVDPDVEELTAATAAGLVIDGQDITLLAFEPVIGNLLPVITAGRAPAAPDEIALGRAAARKLGYGIGDAVPVESDDGIVELALVGYVITPESAGDGSAMTFDGYAALDESATKNLVLVRMRDGAPAAAFERVQALATTPPDTSSTPSSVRSLERVGATPFLLAVVLAILSAALLAHNLITSGRERARDLAVMRALGADRRQLRGTLHWHATTVAVIGLAVGVPLGALLGARVFRYVADRIGVVSTPSIPPFLIAAVVIGVLLVANLAAAWPARLAARVQPAVVLRRS